MNGIPMSLLSRKSGNGPGSDTATLDLQKGNSITMLALYKEDDLEATASLKWSVNGGAFEPVPANWDGEVFWERTTRCFITKGDDLYIIEFERPDRTRPLVINDMPKLNPKAKITILGTTSKLKWKQEKNRQLCIDLSNTNHQEFDALENAWVIKVENHFGR